MLKLYMFFVTPFIILTMNLHASEEMWQPYKDEQFTPEVKALGRQCNVTLYHYNEIDHVNGQDCAQPSGFHIAVTQPSRIGDVSKLRRERTDIPGVKATWEIGNQLGGSNSPKCAIIWAHGAVESDAPHHLGARDSNFGGNNNRLSNLAIQQNCLYYSPNFRGSNGYSAIQNLIDYLRSQGVTEVFISGSSAGAAALNIAANNPNNTDILAGLFYTGTYSSPLSVSNSPAFRAGVPIIFSQGANDKYESIRDSFFAVNDRYPPTQNPNNNMWLQVFENGGHGTPIRMTDWRHNLNWARMQNNYRKRQVSPHLTSNEGIKHCESINVSGIDSFLTSQKNLSSYSERSSGKEESVDCRAFRKGGKYELPFTSDFNRTKGCWPFVYNQAGEVVASVNQINCMVSSGENVPGSFSYLLKNLPIRQPGPNEYIKQRPGCHRQAKP